MAEWGRGGNKSLFDLMTNTSLMLRFRETRSEMLGPQINLYRLEDVA